MRTKYSRVLLKLSGESLMGHQGYGIDKDRLNSYAEQIKGIVSSGVQVAIVIGGGNIFRGLSGAAKGFDRVKGDQMGMLATVINSLALCSALTISTASAAAVQSPIVTGMFHDIWSLVTPYSIAAYSGEPSFSASTATASTSVYSAKNCVTAVTPNSLGAWRTAMSCSTQPRALRLSTAADRLRWAKLICSSTMIMPILNRSTVL